MNSLTHEPATLLRSWRLETRPEIKDIEVFVDAIDPNTELQIRVISKGFDGAHETIETFPLYSSEFTALENSLESRLAVELRAAFMFVHNAREQANNPIKLVEDLLVSSDLYLSYPLGDPYKFSQSIPFIFSSHYSWELDTPSGYTLKSIDPARLNCPILYFDALPETGNALQFARFNASDWRPKWNLALWRLGEAILLSAHWDDREGILKLIEAMRDTESLATMASLMAPTELAYQIRLIKLESSLSSSMPISKESLQKVLGSMLLPWEQTSKRFSSSQSKSFSYVTPGVVLAGNRVIAFTTGMPDIESSPRLDPASHINYLSKRVKARLSSFFRAGKNEYAFTNEEKKFFGTYLENKKERHWLTVLGKALTDSGLHFVTQPDLLPVTPTDLREERIWATNLSETEWEQVLESKEAVSWRRLQLKSAWELDEER